MSVCTPMSSFAYTLFLFTKSDIKTAIVPVSILASAASLQDIKRLPHVIFWIWIHMLHHDLANQILGVEEDKLNKNYRPLPSGRITLRNAQILRWMTVPFCVALSACYSKEIACVTLVIAFLSFVYNELGGHYGWIGRTTVLPLEYAFFEVGACLVAGHNPHKLGEVAILSVLMSAGAYGTTNQATDLKDIEGDSLMGRKTIPIAVPALARPTLSLLMCAWSIALSKVWELDIFAAVAFCAFGFTIAARFMLFRSVAADKKSCLYYNMWLSAVHVLPAYWRFVVSNHSVMRMYSERS